MNSAFASLALALAVALPAAALAQTGETRNVTVNGVGIRAAVANNAAGGATNAPATGRMSRSEILNGVASAPPLNVTVEPPSRGDAPR